MLKSKQNGKPIQKYHCCHVCMCLQGDANRSESDDDKKSDNFDEDEKIEQFRDTGSGVFMIFLFCFYS